VLTVRSSATGRYRFDVKIPSSTSAFRVVAPVAKVAGKRAEWEAKILHQDTDERIGWQSTDGKLTTGTVSFEPIGDERTQIRLAMTYTAEGPRERAGSAVGLDNRRVRGDLERFKELIEGSGTESGAWRGEIKAGRKTSSSKAG